MDLLIQFGLQSLYEFVVVDDKKKMDLLIFFIIICFKNVLYKIFNKIYFQKKFKFILVFNINLKFVSFIYDLLV